MIPNLAAIFVIQPWVHPVAMTNSQDQSRVPDGLQVFSLYPHDNCHDCHGTSTHNWIWKIISMIYSDIFWYILIYSDIPVGGWLFWGFPYVSMLNFMNAGPWASGRLWFRLWFRLLQCTRGWSCFWGSWQTCSGWWFQTCVYFSWNIRNNP